MEPRYIRRAKTGCVLAALLSMAFAEGCAPASEESGGRRANAQTAQVASVPPQDGQAFFIGALVEASAEAAELRNSLQQAGQSNQLEMDVQPMGANETAQIAQVERWHSRGADALLVYVPDTAAAQTLLRHAEARQLPLVIAGWEQAAPATPLPGSASAGMTSAAPVTARNVSPPTQDSRNPRAASLTLFHNGHATRQTLVTSPQELCKSAVATLSAYLRGEKVKPKPHIPSPF